jgi:hypothetical protein
MTGSPAVCRLSLGPFWVGDIFQSGSIFPAIYSLTSALASRKV